MKIDSALIEKLAVELNNELAGGRIEKIQQPAKDIVLLTLRDKKVLLSVRGNYSRIHITDQDFEMPKEPPMFCMLLRKHISGAKILNVLQLNNDRIIEINLENNDELGRQSNEKLIIEMIPKSSNIILTDINYLIIDCIRRKDFDINMYRRIYPGNLYKLPVKSVDYSGHCELDNISHSLDLYFSELEKREILIQRAKDLKSKINSAIKRIEKKIGSQKIELQNTYDREDVRKKAELITANIYRIKKGDSLLICNDYYDDDKEIEIALDPLKTPQQNASKLYKEYNKKKTAEEYLTKLIETGSDQLYYLKSTLDSLNRIESVKDIDDIRVELQETGFIKKDKNRIKIHKSQPPIEIDNILIGRNNKQNDEITFKIADRSFWWFHVKDYHGSHVIIKSSDPTEAEIIKACKLAAEHSEVKGHCAVDYCQVKYVKKPKGALPGKVIYNNYKTKLV